MSTKKMPTKLIKGCKVLVIANDSHLEWYDEYSGHVATLMRFQEYDREPILLFDDMHLVESAKQKSETPDFPNGDNPENPGFRWSREAIVRITEEQFNSEGFRKFQMGVYKNKRL
jgi:hypothetical protein